jgi:hypothetical protein
MQIVSTTERRLIALVARGLFDETLYYRLNVMLLRVGSKNAAGLAADDAEPAHIDSSINVPPS